MSFVKVERSQDSRSKVTSVKVEGHVGQCLSSMGKGALNALCAVTGSNVHVCSLDFMTLAGGLPSTSSCIFTSSCHFFSRQIIPYYQWVPLLMVAQAVLFYAPSVFWNTMNNRGGVDSDSIIAAARIFNKTLNIEQRTSTLKIIRDQINR